MNDEDYDIDADESYDVPPSPDFLDKADINDNVDEAPAVENDNDVVDDEKMPNVATKNDFARISLGEFREIATSVIHRVKRSGIPYQFRSSLS